jgi:ATP-binding protein involved in chromosome partitioning
MSQENRQRLEEALRALRVDTTAKRLGSPGSAIEISEEGGAYRVAVRFGFPVDLTGEDIKNRILEHLRAATPELDVSIDVGWRVEGHAVQHGLTPIEGISNIIAIASGKGGVGKSTLAVNMALALASEGASVGLLDADIYGPSQPTMLGLEGQKPSTKDGKTLEPLSKFGIAVMSIGFLVDQRQPMAWRGPMVTSALNQLLTQTNWGVLDYLVVDMPPGTGDIQLTLAQRVPVSGAVIVTTPQEVALADARKALEMFRKVNVPVLGVIENMSVYVCPSCGHEHSIFGAEGGSLLASEYEVPLLGQLPLQADIRETTDGGAPGTAVDPTGDSGSRFRSVALRAAAELAVVGKDYSRLFPKITVEEA